MQVSGRRRPRYHASIGVYVLVSGVLLGWEERRSVKPSAQPTLVRTQHLPPPAKTARSLRKRGPAGRFLLVTPCISVCHCGSMRSSGCVHMADSVRAERAVRITARFADPRPFCPVSRAPDCRASRSAGSSPSCSRQAAGWPCSYPRPGRAGCRIGPRHLIEAPRRGDRVCVAATGMEDQHGAVASGAVPGSGRRGQPRRQAARVPGVPGQGLDPAEPVMYLSWTGDGPVIYSVPGQGLDPAEPVMYLSWTGDRPVIYLPYTCAGDAPDHEAAMPACGRCERGARSTDVDLAKESGAFHGAVPRYRPGPHAARTRHARAHAVLSPAGGTA